MSSWKENNLVNNEIPSYEETLHICKDAKSFINYIRRNSYYYHLGEFDQVEPALSYITKTIYGDKPITEDFLNMVQEYLNEILALGEEDEIEIWRGLKLNSEDSMDWGNLGTSWTYDMDSAYEFLKYFTDQYEGDSYILYACTDRDNIDWILSICLNLTHINEKELRVIDDSEIEYPYLEKVEEDEW